jgi:hypothetical protein
MTTGLGTLDSEGEGADGGLCVGPALGDRRLVAGGGAARDDDGVEADEAEDALEVRGGEIVRGSDRRA